MTNGETQTDKQSVNQGNWSLSIKCRLEGFDIVVGIMYTICHGSNIFTLRLQSTRLLTVSIYLDVYELPQQSSFTILHDAFKPVTHKYFTKTKLGLAEDNLQNFTQRLQRAACSQRASLTLNAGVPGVQCSTLHVPRCLLSHHITSHTPHPYSDT